MAGYTFIRDVLPESSTDHRQQAAALLRDLWRRVPVTQANGHEAAAQGSVEDARHRVETGHEALGETPFRRFEGDGVTHVHEVRLGDQHGQRIRLIRVEGVVLHGGLAAAIPSVAEILTDTVVRR